MSIAREGLPYILIPAAVSLGLLVLGYWYVAIGFILVTAFMLYFFRDPRREPPQDSRLVVAPADGRVTRVGAIADAPNSPTLVSIFLSPLDVHINRSPIAGEIVDVVYKPGAFHVASRDIASVENEQNVVTVKGRHVTIVFRQIAGLLARRVVFWKKNGDRVGLGERVGLMKFSSRMDVLLPAEVEVTARKGDRLIGGVSVIGRVREG